MSAIQFPPPPDFSFAIRCVAEAGGALHTASLILREQAVHIVGKRNILMDPYLSKKIKELAEAVAYLTIEIVNANEQYTCNVQAAQDWIDSLVPQHHEEKTS